jgi:hypothetical protein
VAAECFGYGNEEKMMVVSRRCQPNNSKTKHLLLLTTMGNRQCVVSDSLLHPFCGSNLSPRSSLNEQSRPDDLIPVKHPDAATQLRPGRTRWLSQHWLELDGPHGRLTANLALTCAYPNRSENVRCFNRVRNSGLWIPRGIRPALCGEMARGRPEI